MSETTLKKVDRLSAVAELGTWEYKGHTPLDAVRVLTADDGGVIVGILDYVDMETVLIPEHMYKSYKTHSHAFAALGALFDDLKRYEKEGWPKWGE